MSDPGSGVDERLVRFEHGIVAVLLLGAFVFGVWYVVPVMAVPLLLRAAVPDGFDWTVIGGSRFPGGGGAGAGLRVDPRIVRTDAFLVGLTLVLATVFFALDVAVLGWLLALAAAVVSAVRAATGASPARRLGRRHSR